MPTVAARRVALPPRPVRHPVPRWALLLALAVAVVVVLAGFSAAAWQGYLLRREAASLEREREALRRQNAALREEIRLLQQPEYVERLAREQLGLVRPDEIAIILVAPTPPPAHPVPREATRPAPPRDAWPWWTRLWQR
ncbi:MAG: septum formation initiator family protein [Armatimonadota bacterium]|nr:septum formation initiator family protein [Armatimonadota bacterium]